jgi:adenosylcobinamide kinase / adenosylcobinamide-phosphate guanylyltransferase
MAEVILYTGGARSGKSSLALLRAEEIGSRKLFVATCPVIDGEMTERIERHKRERSGRGWETIECERELASLFPTPAEQYQVVIIDCLTLWVNNLLYHAEISSVTINDDMVTAACTKWLASSDAYHGTLICVTNEVGLGIVPDNPLARRYRDLVGTCNQTIAAKAKEVVLVTCGLPLYLKTNKA